jgi:hypothetical protein
MAGKVNAGDKLDIEALKARHKELDTLKTREEANLANANHALDELTAEARNQYGTDDVAELRKKLKEMEDENERLRSEYQSHLESIQAKLEQVTREFDETGRGEA